MVEIIWASGSRSGSMFSINLTLKALGYDPLPRVMLNTARGAVIYGGQKSNIDLKTAYKPISGKNDPSLHRDFWKKYHVRSLKIEDVGLDNIFLTAMNTNPQAKAVVSYRKIDKVVLSHRNLPWGLPTEVIIENFQKSYDLFNAYIQNNRLFIFDIEKKENFCPEKFCNFLNVPLHEEFLTWIHDWGIVNDIKEQKTVSGDKSPILQKISKQDQQYISPAVLELEKKYEALCKIFEKI